MEDKKTVKDKDGKAEVQRILDSYTKLCEGRIINKEEAALCYGVDERTIQRDIAAINKFLAERRITGAADMREVKHEKEMNGYVMTGL